jgi:tetratricopeptide (TPR) repeat protein
MSWSRYALLAGIVLALVLVIPTAWFPFQLSKVAVFAVCLLVSVVLFVIGGGVREFLRARGFFAALAVLLLPVLYGVSAALSPESGASLLGFGVETDTVLFVALAALCYLLSFALFRTLRTARMLTTVVFWALIAAAAFQLVSVLFGAAAIPFATFADRSVNLIGKWNDLGLMAALLALLLVAKVELSAVSNIWRIAAAIGGVVLLGLLALVNFPLAWILLLAGCVLIGLLALLRQRAEQRAAPEAPRLSGAHLVPWYASAGVVAAVVLLLYGSAINLGLTKLFPVSSLEVRPGLQSTLGVVNAARDGSVRDVLFGTGPNTFGISWLAHKPAEVNRTPFWNLDFNVGYSTLATAFGSTGFLGALAWLIPLFLLVAAIVRVARLNVLSREERVVATTLTLASLFLIATIVLYVPSQNSILLAFALSGAAFGFLWRQGRSGDEEAPVYSTRSSISAMALAAVLVIAVVGTGFLSARRLVAEAYVGSGLYALAQGDTAAALASADRSLGIERTADALRLKIDAGTQQLVSIAQNTTLKPEEARAQFTSTLDGVLSAGRDALALTPLDYRAYFSLARVYSLLSSLQVTDAPANARAAFAAAAERNPTNPLIPLTMARFEAGMQNAEATQKAVTQALTLKPDYTDAILFVVQINVANNDLKSAIENTKIAVQTAPGVASLWFQLGLLYYAGNDTKNAIPPLEQAIALERNYANAKYFLGLAYYAQGRQNDSLRLFQDLVTSNPENAEVKTIVANLQAGKKPLDGIEPPVAPEDRETAPVGQ